ncbi:MAG TPA: GGDEF domain-containing protein [Syntrophales bacterium]|nr:GGDEF domain-containing protein [Syntrophales bacterium]HPQ43549.1 GGDEF domain-containing protein [Syntrophales bacterium]
MAGTQRKMKGTFDLLSYIVGSAGEFTFEETVFNATALAVSLVAVALAVTTSFLGLHPLHTFAIYFLGILTLLLYCLSRFRHASYPILLILLLCIFLSIIWFTGVGSNGFAGLFFIAGVSLSITLLKGMKRYLFVLVNLLFIIVLVGLEWSHPEWVETYGTLNARYIDYLLNVLLLLIGFGFFIKILVDNLRERTEQLEESNEKLKQTALHDELTGIPNRRLLYAQLENTIQLAKRKDHQFTLLYLDLDDFKKVNDELGHAAGDMILQRVAQRVSGCLRKSDVMARMGGDEFAIILPEAKEERDIEIVTRKILQVIESDFSIQGRIVSVGISIGASIFRPDDVDAEELIRQADEAMYLAKRSGKNRCEFYPINMIN